jgi:hypothetical protein
MVIKNDDGKWKETIDQLYPVYTLPKLREYKPDPSHYIAGNGFLRKGAGCLLVGATGMGKSVLAEQVGLAVSSGQDIFGMKVHGARKVHYIQAENDEDVMQRDLVSIVDNLEMDVKHVNKNFTVRHVFGLSDSSFAQYVEHDIERFQPELIVVDHYQAYTDNDLNKAEAFKQWITPIDEMLKAHGIGLLLVVHKGKPKDVSGWDIRELVYQQMGSSAQANWARTAMEIRPSKNDVRRFDLILTKNADRAGLKDDSGQVLRHIFIEHSDDSSAPYWKKCDVQSAEVTVNYKKLVEEAAHTNPEKSMRWLAKEVGCSVGVIQKYYPQDLLKAKAKAKVKAQKKKKT